MKPCLLYLTCADNKEAEKISQSLLEKRLVVCIKKFPVSSSFLWKGKIDHANEVLLIMESIEEKYIEIKKEVAKLHSYETIVLFSCPITKTTKKVKDWMKEELI